jgi:CDP-4-dehydro-6-deoxyglucose reductase
LQLFPVQILPCRIAALERLSADVVKVALRVPPTSQFNSYPGQYIDIIGFGGLRRSYSIANAGANGHIELHVRQVDGGAMSAYWFHQAQANDLLRLNGPLGTFFLRDIAGLDLVFLATGTGIAPVKAMLESLAVRSDEFRPRTIAVYWGGRTEQDLYWDPAKLEVEHRFIPVLSRAQGDWAGTRGYVQHALLADNPVLQQTSVYACGSDAMIRSAREMLTAAGLPERRFHSDAFVCSAAV